MLQKERNENVNFATLQNKVFYKVEKTFPNHSLFGVVHFRSFSTTPRIIRIT
jgi:hypothetical protein